MTEINKILNYIKEHNEEKYGKIQECCGFYKLYCRCGHESEVTKFLKLLKKH